MLPKTIKAHLLRRVIQYADRADPAAWLYSPQSVAPQRVLADWLPSTCRGWS